MTTENLPAVPQYTVVGAGPYAVGHEYTSGSLVVTVVLAGVATVLAASDYTVAPDSGASGTVTLMADIAATYAGATLLIDRITDVEQGWGSNGTPREDALEAQLDRTVQGQQDLKRKNTRVLQLPIEATGISPVIPAPLAGALLIGNAAATGWENGPDASDIAAAETNAAAAAASQAAVENIILGLFATAPTTDNTGGPLLAGMIYTNTTSGLVFGYDGSAWVQIGAYSHPNHTGDVTSAGDGATTIAAKAVTLPKIQDISQGKLLGRSTAGSGVIEELSAAQFTTMMNFASTLGRGVIKKSTQTQAIDGTQVDVFADVVDTKAAIVALAPPSPFIVKKAASSNPFINFTEFDPTKFHSYSFDISALLPSTNAVYLGVRTSTDGGLNFDAGASDYSWSASGTNSATSSVFSGSPNDNILAICGNNSVNLVGNAAGQSGIFGEFRIHNPQASFETGITGNFAYARSPDGRFVNINSGGVRHSTTAINAIQFFFSAGNIASGEIVMSGIPKA